MGKVTIQSMAKELGLSRNTVAMALKDDPKVAPVTRERVLRMAKRNGYLGENVYVEEVRAPQEKHYNIMVLRTRDAAVYWDRVVSGISEEASLNNCQTRVAVVTEREEENGILPLGLNENIDAIFCIKMLPLEYMQKLVNLGYRIFLRYRTAADGRYRACGRCAAGECSDVPSDRTGHDAYRLSERTQQYV